MEVQGFDLRGILDATASSNQEAHIEKPFYSLTLRSPHSTTSMHSVSWQLNTHPQCVVPNRPERTKLVLSTTKIGLEPYSPTMFTQE